MEGDENCWVDPVAVFRRVAGRTGCVFLDSALRDGNQGRWSILAIEPYQLLVSVQGESQLLNAETGAIIAEAVDPFTVINQWSKGETTATFPFSQGGALGYLGYDLAYRLEEIGNASRDELKIPEIWFGLYDHGVVFDHLERRVHIVIAADAGGGEGDEKRSRQLQFWKGQLETAAAEATAIPAVLDKGSARSNHTAETYAAMVERALEYIHAGDIFQVNLSQRFSICSREEPLAVYLRLRRDNPAPFSAWINTGSFQVLSASPERFLAVSGKAVITRPIKGTRPRGQDQVTDQQLATELWQSEKDRAELVMIVDLHRNDLGRVCEYGSVITQEIMALESYATVHHLVSTILGRLRSEAGIGDLIRAAFPAGSISGAPKVRAMQIIDELEGVRRGIYTGSIGYIGFDGRSDLNVAIRSLVMQEGKAVFQAGGGLVADSIPQEEYRETLHKARAIFAAFGQDVFKFAATINRSQGGRERNGDSDMAER